MKRLLVVHDKTLEEDHPESLDTLMGTARAVDPDAEIIPYDIVDEYIKDGDLVVMCGKEAAAAITGDKKIQVTKRAGNTIPVQIGEYQHDCVVQLSPAYVNKMQSKKGGYAEKAIRLWLDVWEQISQFLEGESSEAPETVAYETEEEILDLLDWLINEHEGEVAYDYETWGDVSALRPELCLEFRIVSVGLAWRETDGSIGNGAFLFDRPRTASVAIEEKWKEFLAAKSTVAHFCRYEHKCNLKRFGKAWYSRDTILQLHALDELADGGLDRVMIRCGLFWGSFKEQYNATRINPMDADVAALLRYNALDAHATLECSGILEAELEEEGLASVARQDERFSLYQARQEISGLFIDRSEVNVQLRRVTQEADQANQDFQELPEVRRTCRWATKNIKSMMKKEPDEVVFNPKSVPMMHNFLMKQIKIPKAKLTIKEKGQEKITMKKDVLEKLAPDYPVLSQLNKFRSDKAMQIFLEKWDQYIGPDNCVHSQYNQTVVVTGRLSSTDPPLQNIPKDNQIRRIFTSRFGEDGVIINADYKQQEPRLMAGWSQEEKMIQAILTGMDLHAFVGCEIFGADYDEIVARHKAGEKVQVRDVGKRMNLGIMYGQTEFGLSQKTGISVDEARKLLRRYDEMFPGIATWIADRHRQAIHLGYVEDLFGARRHLPGAQSANKWERERALRQASNYPIQGTAYRFTQIGAGVAIDLFDDELPDHAFVVGQVHDSIIVDCHKDKLGEILGIIEDAMGVHNHMDYWKDSRMPMDIDISMGPNLYDQKPVKMRTA